MTYIEDLSRDDLERLALQAVTSDYYYDLADNIDGASDEDLYAIINGDYSYDNHYDVIDMTGASHDNEGNPYPNEDR